MDPEPGSPKELLTIERQQLEEMFSKVKSADYTQSQFERDKTERVTALCAALAAVADDPPSTNSMTSNYGVRPRQEILQHLTTVMNAGYAPYLPPWRTSF